MEKTNFITLDQSLPLSKQPQRKKATAGDIAKKTGKSIGFYIVILLLACFFLFPFIVMICVSLLTDGDVFLQVLISPTRTVEIGNYIAILTPGSNYFRYVGNSLLVAVICTVGIPFVSSLCAFGFSKCKFHGRDVMFSVVLATIMIPGVISIIPLYAIYARFGWLDTLIPLWLPSLFGGGATNIFLMRQFFRGIPDDVLSAAKIDGAGTFRLYWQFCLPLCIPVMLYVGYQSFVGSWNNFAAPMMYIDSASKYTLALGVYFDFGPPSSSYANAAMAAGVVMTLPCIILFIIFQRYLIEGVSVTGLKG